MSKNIQQHILMAFMTIMMCFAFFPSAVYVQAETDAKPIAHRGYAKGDIAPNSLRAFKEAGDSKNGYWAIESDVCSTKDGKLIMLHDKKLNEMVKISESDANYGKSINNLKYDDIKNYHLLTRSGKESKDKIPTFDDYLKACKASGKTAIIELKHVESKYYDDIIKAISDNKMTKNVVFHCDDMTALAAMNAKKGAKDIPKWAIAHTAVSDSDINYMIANGITGINFRYNLVTDKSVQKAKDNGLKVGIWTIAEDTVDDCASAISVGNIDYITGDSPDLIKQAKEKAKKKAEDKKEEENTGKNTSSGKTSGNKSGNKGKNGSQGSSGSSSSDDTENARGMAQRFMNLMFYIFYVIGFFFIVIGIGHFFLGATSGNTESRNKGLFMMAAGLVLLLTPTILAGLNIMDLA